MPEDPALGRVQITNLPGGPPTNLSASRGGKVASFLATIFFLIPLFLRDGFNAAMI